MSKREWSFSRKNVIDNKKSNPFVRSELPSKVGAKEIACPKVDLKSDSSVFVSYAREDLALVQQLVNWLRKLGITVVWDQDIPVGARFHEKIRTSIEHARLVIVVWTSTSRNSDFVLDEADLAKRDGKLLPVIADDLDLDNIPLGFGRLQTASVSDIDAIRHGLAEHNVISNPPHTI